MLKRSRILAFVAGLALVGGAARALAVPIFEPNNKVQTATLLTPGQLVVDDSLNANVGRPDTLLGWFNPTYSTLLGSADNGSPLGNGLASQMLNVPLRSNGSAYFRVTGAGDSSFNCGHTQSGRYYVRFDLYDSHHNFFKSMSLVYESVAPGMVDNVWLDPPLILEPERVGGTVDVTVNNIVGAGSGDSVDFFWFSGMLPNQPFMATLTADTFNPLLGWFGGASNTLLGASDPNAATPLLMGVADSQGHALLAVTGAPDAQFKGEHAEVGTYTLVVMPEIVPEPSGIVLLASGGLLAGYAWRRRKRVPPAACQ